MQLTLVHNMYSNGIHIYRTFRYPRLITISKLKNLLLITMKNQDKVNQTSTICHYQRKPWRYSNSRNPIPKNVGILKKKRQTQTPLTTNCLTFWLYCRTTGSERQWWYRSGKKATWSECNAGFIDDSFLWWYGSTSNIACFVIITTFTTRDHGNRRHFPSHPYPATFTQLCLLGGMPSTVSGWRTSVLNNVACASV